MRTPTKKHPEAAIMHRKIAAEIRHRRIKMGLSQGQLAIKLKVTQASISQWESGRFNFSVSLLMYICEKMGLHFNLGITEKEK